MSPRRKRPPHLVQQKSSDAPSPIFVVSNVAGITVAGPTFSSGNLLHNYGQLPLNWWIFPGFPRHGDFPQLCYNYRRVPTASPILAPDVQISFLLFSDGRADPEEWRPNADESAMALGDRSRSESGGVTKSISEYNKIPQKYLELFGTYFFLFGVSSNKTCQRPEEFVFSQRQESARVPVRGFQSAL